MMGTVGTCEVVIGLQGGDAAVVLCVGEQVLVRLAETPTTGYRWQVETEGPVLSVDDRYEGPVGPPGAGGTRVLTFEAAAAGAAEVHLALRRAWGDPTPVATARVRLSVQGTPRGSA